jgi:transcriptional regulator with XRE-family HTH domain
MLDVILRDLGTQLKAVRATRGLTQPDLANRLGRDRARISEFERDLLNAKVGRDRFALFVEICDALDLTPLLVPRTKLAAVAEMLGPRSLRTQTPAAGSTAFDDVFVDLSDGRET